MFALANFFYVRRSRLCLLTGPISLCWASRVATGAALRAAVALAEADKTRTACAPLRPWHICCPPAGLLESSGWGPVAGTIRRGGGANCEIRVGLSFKTAVRMLGSRRRRPRKRRALDRGGYVEASPPLRVRGRLCSASQGAFQCRSKAHGPAQGRATGVGQGLLQRCA